MGANGGGGGIVGGVDRCEIGLFTTAVAIACADATRGLAAVQWEKFKLYSKYHPTNVISHIFVFSAAAVAATAAVALL